MLGEREGREAENVGQGKEFGFYSKCNRKLLSRKRAGSNFHCNITHCHIKTDFQRAVSGSVESTAGIWVKMAEVWTRGGAEETERSGLMLAHLLKDLIGGLRERASPELFSGFWVVRGVKPFMERGKTRVGRNMS